MDEVASFRVLSDIVRARAKTAGNAPATLFDGVITTYGELDERSDRCAAALLAAGVGNGDRVVVLSRNHDRWFEVLFGAAKIGACLTPLNCRLAPAEIAWLLADATPAAIFVGADFLDLAESVVATLEAKPILVALNSERAGFADYLTWRDAAPPLGDAPEPSADDDVIQMYTSGTTGRPKGVVLSHRNITATLALLLGLDGFGFQPGESILIVMPLFHVGGLIPSLLGLARGCRLVVLADFAPASVVESMIEAKVAQSAFVPAMIQALLSGADVTPERFPHLKTIAYGASPISRDLLTRAQAGFGCDFAQMYGMTESTATGTYLSPRDHDVPARLDSCGRAWPGVEVRIVNASGETVPDGTTGEIVIRSPGVMKGYWRHPEATAETIVDGWLHTGDAGYRDGDGYFHVQDRMKDMIISGGENIYPAEVENAIAGCPGVADVAVIAVPSERWGEAVKAIVVPAVGHAPSEADVIAWARARIAAYKAPTSVSFVDALPRNASGKVLRRELRAPYWAGQDRAVA